MAGERQLDRRREDTHGDVPVCLRRVHEGRLGEVQLLREQLKLLLRDLAGVGEDGHLVSGERFGREDVADDVAEGGHATSLTAHILGARCDS